MYPTLHVAATPTASCPRRIGALRTQAQVPSPGSSESTCIARQWEVEHFLELKTTEYSLRRSFAIISVRSIEGRELGILRINLFLLATGPYHHELSVPLP
jgi:hypothetical protein